MRIVVDTNILINAMEIIEPISHIKICRDPDDDKFLECAKDANSLYIVSGDKDLLEIKDYEGIRILTAKDFCENYLSDALAQAWRREQP